MVRPGLVQALGLALCLGLAPSLGAAEAAKNAAIPADPALAPLPARPEPQALMPNQAAEDLAAVSIVSLPFTAFWSLLGALIVASVSQQQFPPEIDTPMLAGAAAVAGATSLGIGLVSIHWGGSAKAPAP